MSHFSGRKTNDWTQSELAAWHGAYRSDIAYKEPEAYLPGVGHERPPCPTAAQPMHEAATPRCPMKEASNALPVCPTCGQTFEGTMAAWAHNWLTVCNPAVPG